MLYAVVDIETTGGYAAAHGITEIAIYIHNGEEVVDSFETLINPHQPIPMHIQALTGINDDMVADAPDFREVADHIYELLHDKIFVAHNVNFDYSFVRHHLEACGHQLQVKKLCTVRLSRKVFPGLASYSLGRLCKALNITINNRHRAAGDAEATATLLGMIVNEDQAGVIADTLKKGSREQVLPPNLLREAIDKLPNTPGVYYFKNEKGKVVYVGKAKQLKKRVCTHFTGHSISQQRQNFLKSIFHIDFVSCGTELMAFILEASEIKKLWPANNRAMKRFEQKYSLYHFEDQNGYIRLGIDKHRKDSHALYSFNYLLEGHELLRKLVAQHSLCEKLCFIQTLKEACTHHASEQCNGACIGEEAPEDYNYRVDQAIKQLQDLLPSFILVDQGRTDDEQSCIWVEKGKFYGMGYIANYADVNDLESLKSAMEPYPSNDYIMNLILSHQSRFPAKAIPLTIIQQNSEAIDFTFT
ncbi:exonuclease domain-containing protein [Pedobacter sp. KR3-3]|uniref:Exonuclease domain-containing protein n=1 Tax=Pedobacter albus TaxID=3113905 RepID=A0ABU7I2M9_9SPHI|nr:exonuclease domain-containing protein [Pedobacter sp. KR3-3]MEE1943724.1 exonuclease domain-containing protein [Pedobacter sp. KR3-3]